MVNVMESLPFCGGASSGRRAPCANRRETLIHDRQEQSMRLG
jgi:hypothetical protein